MADTETILLTLLKSVSEISFEGCMTGKPWAYSFIRLRWHNPQFVDKENKQKEIVFIFPLWSSE